MRLRKVNHIMSETVLVLSLSLLIFISVTLFFTLTVNDTIITSKYSRYRMMARGTLQVDLLDSKFYNKWEQVVSGTKVPQTIGADALVTP